MKRSDGEKVQTKDHFSHLNFLEKYVERTRIKRINELPRWTKNNDFQDI